jgi:type III pantothenate kinase
LILLLDIGNTRLKWAWLENGRAGSARAVPHQAAAAAWQGELEAFQGELELDGRSADRMLVANVAGGSFARQLGGWSKARLGFWPEFVSSSDEAAGVTNAYREPEALGVDRWLALIAARAAAASPACVVNAGTAVTVDAIDAAGRQLGGFILPGMQLMRDSLYARTQNVQAAAEAEPAAARGIYGINTAGAVEHGIALAVATLAERVAEELERAATVPPRILLTGGDAQRLKPYLRRAAELVPDLVLAGLAVLAHEARS